MTQKDLIRAEIERQLEYFKGKEDDAWDDCDNYTDEDAQWYQGHWKMCSKLLAFIDSLPEEHLRDSTKMISEDLKEAAKEYSKRVSDGHNYRDLTCGFIAGAEWQKEQMLKDAVEGEVVQDLHGKLHVKTNAVSDILYQFGDKVKVIILPKK